MKTLAKIIILTFLLPITLVVGFRAFLLLENLAASTFVYSDSQDKLLAESIEFALRPIDKPYHSFFRAKNYTPDTLTSKKLEYDFKNTEYVCFQGSKYSTPPDELFKKLKVKPKFTHAIRMRRQMTGGEGGALLLIVKNNGDFIPIYSNSDYFEIETSLKFFDAHEASFEKTYDNILEPVAPCANVKKLKIKVTSGKQKNILTLE